MHLGVDKVAENTVGGEEPVFGFATVTSTQKTLEWNNREY